MTTVALDTASHDNRAGPRTHADTNAGLGTVDDLRAVAGGEHEVGGLGEGDRLAVIAQQCAPS
jgi:hypothetical protein